MEEMLKEVVESLNEKEELGGAAEFSDRRYKSVPVDKKNFCSLEGAGDGRKVVFIDGGNAEIAKGSSFSLQLARVYYTIYSNNKRVSNKRVESFVLVKAEKDGDSIVYRVKSFGELKIDIAIDSFDKSMKTGDNRVNVSKIGDLARGLAELDAAKQVIGELKSGDIIVRDGSLQAKQTGEEGYFDLLYESALAKGVIVCGLAKTTELLTDKGASFPVLLNSIAPSGRWYYHPVVEVNSEKHKAEIYFVKLHEMSERVFRFEIFNEQKDKAEEVLQMLALNSGDAVFPGYPYGLIEADQFARVSGEEKERLLMQVIAKMGKDWERVEGNINSMNAHEILDNIG